MNKTKVAVALLATLSLSTAFANNNAEQQKQKKWHAYPKIGAAVYSRYSPIVASDATYSSAIKLSPTTSKAGNYTRFSLDITRQVSKNWEIGLGVAYHKQGKAAYQNKVGYQGREFLTSTYVDSNGVEVDYDSSTDTYYVQGTNTVIAKSDLIQQDTSLATYTEKQDFDFTLPRYKSLPVYVTAKYNFETESQFKPYVKFDVGWSYNKVKNANSKLTQTYSNINLTSAGEQYVTLASTLSSQIDTVTSTCSAMGSYSSYCESYYSSLAGYASLDDLKAALADTQALIANIKNTDSIKVITPATIKLKMRHGLYLGFNTGFEYKNFVFEAGYHKTFAKLVDVATNHKYRYNNDEVVFSIGYHF